MEHLSNIFIENVPEFMNFKRSQLAPKVRKKLGKLHKWKIDSSRIRFTAKGPIAEGGYATVARADLLPPGYDATPEDTDGTVTQDIAVKKMKLADCKDRSKVLGLTLREGDFLTSISHRNVISFIGIVEDILSDVAWLVFPWAENGNLRDFVALTDWEVPERIWLINGVIAGLEYLHALKPPICHGDLKSVNILVNSDRDATITDFGSARRIRHKSDRTDSRETREEHGEEKPEEVPETVLDATVCESTNTITLTKSSFTLRWAAPEVLKDEDKGIESDVWSFGWVCYEVMTGRVPFENDKTSLAVTLSIFKGALPSLDDHVRMTLIRQLGSLMVSCWSVDARGRPSAEACKKSLRWMPKCRPSSTGLPSTAEYRANLLMQQGEIHVDQSNYSSASHLFEEALILYTDAEFALGKADALRRLADMRRMQGEFDEANTLYTDCFRVCDSIPDTHPDHVEAKTNRASGKFGLAEIQRNAGRNIEAMALYSECVQTWDEMKDEQKKAESMWGLAMIYVDLGKEDEAISLCNECCRIADEGGDKRSKVDALIGLAYIHRKRDDHLKAKSFLPDVIRICDEIGEKTRKTEALFWLAEIHRMEREYDNAIQVYSECVRLSNETGHSVREAESLWGLAEVRRYQSEHDKAIASYSESLQSYERIGDILGKGDCLRGLADVHRAENRSRTAIDLYEQAADMFRTGGRTDLAEVVLQDAADLRALLSSND